jgi:hypothetical protein
MWSLGWHTGVDYACPAGTNIVAPAPGYVARVAWDNAYGRYILLRVVIGGKPYNVYLCHLSSVLVAAGDQVRMGQHIGESGATGNVSGPHLHLEVRESPYGFNGNDIVNPSVVYNYTGSTAVTQPTYFDLCVYNIARERWYTEWDTRKAEIQRELYDEASVYCFQELFEAEAVNTIKAALPRCHQFTGPAGLEFFYDADKWRFISGANLYSGIARRYMQSVVLERISTGQRVHFFNLHAPIEAEGDTAKERYAAWALPKIKASPYPKVAAGDFNSTEGYSPKKEFRAAGFIGFKEQASITNESVKEFIPSGKDLCDIRTQPAGPADITGGEVDVSTTSLESDHRRIEARIVITP